MVWIAEDRWTAAKAQPGARGLPLPESRMKSRKGNVDKDELYKKNNQAGDGTLCLPIHQI